MSIRERTDKMLATHTGQTVGWVLIFAIVLGFFSQAGSDVTFLATVIALALSWYLGVSYGRSERYDVPEQDDRTE